DYQRLPQRPRYPVGAAVSSRSRNTRTIHLDTPSRWPRNAVLQDMTLLGALHWRRRHIAVYRAFSAVVIAYAEDACPIPSAARRACVTEFFVSNRARILLLKLSAYSDWRTD